MADSLLHIERKQFHRDLLDSCLTKDSKGIPSNADKHQKTSRMLATSIMDKLGQGKTQRKDAGQRSGNAFESICEHFLKRTFPHLSLLRPGKWEIQKVPSRHGLVIASYEQYAHLIDLNQLAKQNQTLAAALGNDYTISPDIVVLRYPESDEEINQPHLIVDDTIALHASIRKSTNPLPILHASVSCKWTIRSDRAQNARTEALNLLRNRKGRAPHIVVLTAEPTPSRIASLALGTGDIDCVYHFALPELIESVEELENDEATNMLQILIQGKRLKDIADLPLDLAV